MQTPDPSTALVPPRGTRSAQDDKQKNNRKVLRPPRGLGMTSRKTTARSFARRAGSGWQAEKQPQGPSPAARAQDDKQKNNRKVLRPLRGLRMTTW